MMKTKTIGIFLLLSCLAPALPARAIQLSLEENRQETGHIGFIDMQRIFQQFPETIRAKENFEELVRQSEEQVNIRKVELIHLRNDLAQLKAERKLLEQYQAPAPIAAAAPAVAKPAVEAPAPVPAPAPAPASAAPYAPVAVSSKAAPAPVPAPRAAPVAVVGGSGPAPVAMATTVATVKPVSHPMGALPGFGEASSDMPGGSFGWKASASTAPAAQPAAAQAGPPAQAVAKNQPLIINIPGISTAPIVVQPPPQAAVGSLATTAAPAIHAVSTATASAPIAAKPSVSSATATAPSAESENQKSAELADMDAKISAKEKDLTRKEDGFKQYQAEAEKNLLDLEGRKTEILLGKIHKAIEDVARQEGVSVVVDKTSILYGHDAVDLTDKVLKYLRSS